MDLFGVVGKSTLMTSKSNRLYLEVILYTPVIKVVGIDNEQKDAGIRVNFFDNVQKLAELLKAGSRISLMVSELRAQPYVSANNNNGPAVSFNAIGLGFQYLPVNNRPVQNGGQQQQQPFQQPVQQPMQQQPFQQPVQQPMQQQYQQQQQQPMQQQYQQPTQQPMQQQYQQQQQPTQQPIQQQPVANTFQPTELEDSTVVDFLKSIDSNNNI